MTFLGTALLLPGTTQDRNLALFLWAEKVDDFLAFICLSEITLNIANIMSSVRGNSSEGKGLCSRVRGFDFFACVHRIIEYLELEGTHIESNSCYVYVTQC